jgi:hypothetical protein
MCPEIKAERERRNMGEGGRTRGGRGIQSKQTLNKNAVQKFFNQRQERNKTLKQINFHVLNCNKFGYYSPVRVRIMK